VAVTEMQTLILWALLAKPEGASFQKDIKPKVEKPDREALVKAGLITGEKRGRPGYWLEVTDKGWAWAADNLDAALPKRSPAGSVVFRDWLAQLKVFMQARGLALADILGPQHTKVGPAIEAPAEPTEYAIVRERIRKAYLDLTGGRFNTRALLSELREKLEDLERDTLDDALKKMHLEPGTTLSGLNNPQEITQAVRDAALSFKGEPMYVLWITK
jgi:hypothetical protein